MKMKSAIVAGVVVVVAASLALIGSGTIGDIEPGWRVSQDCTPAAPGDTAGSVGSASLDAGATSTSLFAIDNDFTLTDTTSGTFKGNVVASPVAGSRAHLDVAGKLNFLVADRNVAPVWYDAADPIFFGEEGAAAGQFTNVYGVAIDPFDGSYFVSSYGSGGAGRYVIVKFNAAGQYVTEFGAFGSGNGQFGGASGIAVSPVDGRVAIGDGINQRVQVFVPNGGRTAYTYDAKIGSNGSGNGQFGNGQPIPVVWDSVGALYAGDRGNTRIQKFTVGSGSVTYSAQVAIAGTWALAPYALAIDSANTVYASLFASTTANSTATMLAYNTSLVLQNTIVIPALPATIGGILNIAAGPVGTLYANWGQGNFIVKYTISGSDAVEEFRWYSGYPATAELNTNYNLAVSGSTVSVLFRSVAWASTQTFYGQYRVTSFDWSPVPLSDAIEGYMRACDATLGGLTFSYDADYDPAVIFPAWSGDVWSKLKELCTAYQVEIYLDGDVIRVDDIGSRTVTVTNHTPMQITPSNIFGGQQIVVVAQNPRAGGGVIFDASTQNTRFQIDVGQARAVIVNTLNYPVSVDALVPTDTLPVLPGQYYVLDSTGVHVPAATWIAAGASIAPSVGGSPGQVGFTITGPTFAISGYTGPFTFADSTAATGRAALILTGTGVFTEPVPYTFETGANPEKTTTLVARTINSFAIADLTQVAMVTPAAIEDVSGVAVAVAFQMPVADLNGFGLTPGSLFYAEDSRYRIRSVQFGGLTATITAVRHVTLDDIDGALAGLTYDQQDAIWAGFSFDDRTIKPLALAL